jgi:hypothetical protein
MDCKIGDVVQIGTSRHTGKIVNIIQPTGTYSMYTIHNYFDGTITNCAKHELVKGMIWPSVSFLVFMFSLSRTKSFKSSSVKSRNLV